MHNPSFETTNISTGNISFDDAEDAQIYITLQVAITPAEAQEMVSTLGSNSSTARATRDPLAREILEGIEASGVLNN